MSNYKNRNKMSLLKTNGSMFPTLLSNFFDNDSYQISNWFEREINQSFPALNIKESTKDFSIELVAPGYSKSDFKITSENGVLSISAEKNKEKNEEKKHFTRKEFSYESFTRTLQLPDNSLPDKIDAKYEDGLLKLTLPKKEITSHKEKKEIKVS
jgi:HSP20 family protein